MPHQFHVAMATLTVHCRWEDETVRERTGCLSLYAEATKAKKMKLLMLHTHGYPRASLKHALQSLSSKLQCPLELQMFVLKIKHENHNSKRHHLNFPVCFCSRLSKSKDEVPS